MGETKNTEAVEAFIRRWQGREGGQQRANYVSFLNELIALLGLPPPDPADATHEHNDYVFERAVRKHRDEGDSPGRIDLYKKNSSAGGLALSQKQFLIFRNPLDGQVETGILRFGPVPMEGRLAIVTNAGRDAVDAGGAARRAAQNADGEVVWS